MGSKLIYGLHENPVIAAVNDLNELKVAVESECEVIFVLKSNILEIKECVETAHKHEKVIFIHADLVDGLSKDVIGLEYIINQAKPDGIITTSQRLIKKVKAHGLIAIQRLFILDSINLKTGIESVEKCDPDAIEILPGVMPQITKIIVDETRKPVITGGLIQSKNDVMNSLNAGAIGISTSKKEIWEL
jgi:glycerol uptake operon antiterminator